MMTWIWRRDAGDRRVHRALMISLSASQLRDQADESQIHRELDAIVAQAQALPDTDSRSDLDPPITVPKPSAEKTTLTARFRWRQIYILLSTAAILLNSLVIHGLVLVIMAGITVVVAAGGRFAHRRR
jgi:hypothetical protein